MNESTDTLRRDACVCIIIIIHTHTERYLIARAHAHARAHTHPQPHAHTQTAHHIPNAYAHDYIYMHVSLKPVSLRPATTTNTRAARERAVLVTAASCKGSKTTNRALAFIYTNHTQQHVILEREIVCIYVIYENVCTHTNARAHDRALPK